MEDLNARVEFVSGQLQNQLDDLRKSVQDRGSIPSEGDGSRCKSSCAAMDKLKEFEVYMKKVLVDLKNEIAEFGKNISRQCEYLRRQSFENCLLIHGVKESEKENIYSEVCSILVSKIQADVTIKDLSVCYRMGKLGNGSPTKSRAIFVRFVHQWKRNCIFAEKKKLKGSGVAFTEMLTAANYTLMKQVRSRIGVKNCWSWQGNIFGSIGGTSKRIRHIGDIPEFF